MHDWIIDHLWLLSIGFFLLVVGALLIADFWREIIGFFRQVFGLEDSSAQRKSSEPLGYKYANISRKPGKFVGLANGKPYGIQAATRRESMGFHSYGSLRLLQRNIDSYRRGSLLLEVLHHGEVTEYEDGWVSTEQRVLQIAPADVSCMGGFGDPCNSEVEFQIIFGKRFSMHFCRPHRAAMRLILFFLPWAKAVNIGQWIEDFAASAEAEGVAVRRTRRELKATR